MSFKKWWFWSLLLLILSFTLSYSLLYSGMRLNYDKSNFNIVDTILLIYLPIGLASVPRAIHTLLGNNRIDEDSGFGKLISVIRYTLMLLIIVCIIMSFYSEQLSILLSITFVSAILLVILPLPTRSNY